VKEKEDQFFDPRGNNNYIITIYIYEERKTLLEERDSFHFFNSGGRRENAISRGALLWELGQAVFRRRRRTLLGRGVHVREGS